MASLPTGEVLLLTRYQLICIDLLNNNETFNLEFENASKLFVEDGKVLVVCEGDLFCYDYQGEEQFVNHCSANIQAICTYWSKGQNEVVAGLSDLTMLRYKGVNLSYDYGKVAGTPTSLCMLGEGVLLGTEEGTVAYYESKKSKWKAKSSHPVAKVMAYRGETETLAIIARRDGIVEIKDWKGKGETSFKIKLQEEIVGVFVHDFRQDDNLQYLVVHRSGTFKGLNIYEEERKAIKKKVADEIKMEDQEISVLDKERLQLEYEVAQLREEYFKNESEEPIEHIVAPEFTLNTYLHHEKDGLTLTIMCQNGYISGLSFEEPLQPVSYDRQQQIAYVFKSENIVFGEVTCYALVHSNYNSKIYEARPFKIELPKFWKYNFDQENQAEVVSGVGFKLVERNARYIKWISQGFFMKWTEEEKEDLESVNPLKLKFYNPYEKVVLQLLFKPKEGKVEIWCDCLKTLGEIFQDLMDYVGVTEMNSELWFPKEKDKLKLTLSTIERLSQAKISLSSEMADAINNIKFLMVKGESARCVGAMKDMRRSYTDIMGFNRNLMT